MKYTVQHTLNDDKSDKDSRSYKNSRSYEQEPANEQQTIATNLQRIQKYLIQTVK